MPIWAGFEVYETNRNSTRNMENYGFYKIHGFFYWKMKTSDILISVPIGKFKTNILRALQAKARGCSSTDRFRINGAN